MYKKLPYLILLVVLFGWVNAQAAEFEWMRAAFCDTRYPAAWAGVGVATRDALVAAGYTALNADELKTWMTARISDKKLSVVVFCQDVVPDTVVESQSSSCTLRKYLDSGGKIVWYGDIPFYYWGHSNGAMDTWGDAGAPAVLGFNTSSATRDTNQAPRITAAGAKWGLTSTWTSQRPLMVSVTTNVTVLALDGNGAAPAWVKHYKAGDKFRGFVRFRDTGGQADVAEIMRLAEFVDVKASNPTPSDGATGVVPLFLKWDASSFAQWHVIYLGTTPDLTEADRKGRQTLAQTLYPIVTLGLEPGATYYWRIDEEEAGGVVRTGDVWSFTTAPLKAFDPSPRNGDKWIDPNANLTWQGGQDAFQHDLYFGTDKDAVTARDPSVSQGVMFLTEYDPGTLQPGTTYYWVVDEIDGGYMGDLWSFTTNVPGTGGVKAEYFGNMTVSGAPFLTQVEPEINHSWGDPGGPAPGVVDQFSARWTADLEIAVADTYTFITTSDDGARLWLNDVQIINGWVDQSTTDWLSEPQKLEPGIYSLRMEYYENGGGAVAQLSWQTPTVARQIIPAGPLQPPVRAKAIYPKDNDVNVPQDITLMWSTGEKAVTHDVYFGEEEAAVASATPADAGLYKGSQALESNTWSPGALEWNKTYYWRIDEVNAAESDSPWTGAVWSFTTADFLVVDDFESYTDDVSNRIFQTWIDGWGYTEPAPGDPGNGTGSTVGYGSEPFSEHSTVHSGGSSMPFAYNNADSPYYSETERTFDSPQNWTVNGVNTLSLYVHGYPAVTATTVTETGGKMTLTGDGADIWGNSDAFTFAYKSLSGDATIVAKVVSNGTGSNAWAKGGVMIRDSLDGGSMHAMMVMTAHSANSAAGNGASFQYRNATDGTSGNSDSTAVVAPPYWVKLERIGDTFTGYHSPDGNTWTMVGSQEVILTAPVYIGICVTSHAAGEQRTFQFEGIKTTGSVTGQWQGAVIDSPKYNSAQDFYVAIQDSSNKMAIVTDATAVNADTWTQVLMPLSSFSGVNMTRVTKVFIGVGNRNSPVADGSGMLFIDDIRVIKPAP